jgi:Holliday junction resolvasome RuvABC DNA-binding subunit
LELKPKIDQFKVVISGTSGASPAISADAELVEALIALGYRRPDAEQTASKTNPAQSTEERLKDALQRLAKS